MSDIIGFGEGCGKELVMLNRTIRINDDDDCMELVPDAKHVDLMVGDLGLINARTAETPREKISEQKARELEESPLLNQEGQRIYRSATMRAAYLSQDRVDITEAVKCLSRHMSSPREGHLTQLKRLVRYLKGRPNIVIKYPRQDVDSSHLIVHTDSDWAGETITRRSTSGMVIRRGKHLIRHSSTLQTSIGLSSAEAEYYAMTKGAAYAFGIQSLYRDWQLELSITLFSDSSSAVAFAKRRGLGKNRHIATRYLWLQERVAMKNLKLAKVKTDENPADLFTKCLSQRVMIHHCQELQQFRRAQLFRLNEEEPNTDREDF
jgi:hypothetical protein